MQDVRVHKVDTALEAVVEVALTTATGKHLSLNHDGLAAEALGSLIGLLGRLGRDELGRVDAVLVQETHREMLMNRQETLLRGRGRASTQHVVRHRSTRTEQVECTDHGNRGYSLARTVPHCTQPGLAITWAKGERRFG